MFRDAISRTPYTTSEANTFFGNINAEAYQRDVTTEATLRALLEPRITKDEYVSAHFTSGNFSRSRVNRAVENSEIQEYMYEIVRASNVSDGSIWFYSLNSYSDDNKAALEFLETHFTEVYNDWQKLDNIREFYRKQFYTVCFVNTEIKSAIVFVDALDLRKLHLLLCSIPAILPWYFSKEVGITETELELLKSLRERTSGNYLRILTELSQKYDFRTLRIKTLLDGFETVYERNELSRVNSEIEDIYRYLGDLDSQYSSYLRQVRDLQIKAMGLDAKINSAQENGESEIMEYFLCNKSVILEEVSDDMMKFVSSTYLEFFDEDMAQRMIDNPNSVIYKPNGRACNNYILAEDMKKLMTAIFIDQTLKIKFCSAYQFRLTGNVAGLSGYQYPAELNDRMPNTHIDRYSCLGTYERHINQALREGNYIGAIEQCIASGKSLNFSDSTVMAAFIKRFYGLEGDYSHRKFIELPDGTGATPAEAVEWLKSQEANVNE